jgi:hypothetical protein
VSDGEPAYRFCIPAPPSTNNLHGSHIDKATGKLRRHNTAVYKAWIDEAGWEIRIQGDNQFGIVPLPVFPNGLRQLLIEGVAGIDSDNIKAIPDLLKRMKIIKDDKLIDRLVIERGKPGDKVTVSIWPM